MARIPPSKLFIDDDYIDDEGEYKNVPAPNPYAAVQQSGNSSTLKAAQEELLAMQKESEERAKKAAADKAAAEADAEAARQAKIAALKATREAEAAKKKLEAQIADTKSLGFEGIKPPDPPADDNYTYKYMWHVFAGGGGEWRLIRFPRYNTPNLGSSSGSPSPKPITQTSSTSTQSTEGISLGTSLISPPVTPTPPKPPAPPPPPPPPPKTAPIDTILFDDDSIPIEIMSDLIFEDIGGHEIINIARNDTINGQSISYQPIKNLTAIQQQYNPNNIVSLQNTSDRYFANFAIKLETKLPDEGEGSGPSGAYVYIEDTTGDLIVELINLETDEQIEVQISLSGTIYEAEFNES